MSNTTKIDSDNNTNDGSESLSSQHFERAKDDGGKNLKMISSSADDELVTDCDQADVNKMEICGRKDDTEGVGDDKDGGDDDEERHTSNNHETEKILGGECLDESVRSLSTDVVGGVIDVVGENVNYTCRPSSITHAVPSTSPTKVEVPELITNSVDDLGSVVSDNNADLKNDFDSNGYNHFSSTPSSPSSSYVNSDLTGKKEAHDESLISKTGTASLDASNLTVMNAEVAFHKDDEKKMDSLDVHVVESIDKKKVMLASDGDDGTQLDLCSPLASSIAALNKIDDNFATASPPLIEHTTPQIPTNPVLPKPRQSVHEVSASPSRVTYASPPGRRSIKLRLLEEVEGSHSAGTPFSKRLNLSRRFRSLSLSTVMVPLDEKSSTDATSVDNTMDSVIDRGTITVSWYEGTTSSEMQEHVTNCVLRKLNSPLRGGSNGAKIKLEDVRLLDENVTPCEGEDVGCHFPSCIKCFFLHLSFIKFFFGVCIFRSGALSISS